MGSVLTCMTCHWRPRQGGMGQNKTQPSPQGLRPKPQDLQVSQITCSQKLKGNQPYSFFRQ